MKKESVKKQIETMLEAAQEVYWCKDATELQVSSGKFKAHYCMKPGDEASRREMEEHLRKRAASVARGHVISRAEMERRSNNFQKALAYIGEHRHLIPFFRFVDEYLHQHTKKSETDAVREWKKKHKSLPEEVKFESWGFGSQGHFTLGDKMPRIDIVAAQILYLPKAWLL